MSNYNPANTFTTLGYANTFGDWVVTTNNLVNQNNDLAANNFYKASGTMYLEDATLGLQVSNNAIVGGQIQSLGIGSGVYVQNNLVVGGQAYYTNTTTSIFTSGAVSVGGQLTANGTGYGLNVANNSLLNGTLYVLGTGNFGSNVYVSGGTFLSNTLSVTGNTSISNTIYVTKDGNFSANVNITGNTNAELYLNVSQDIKAQASLYVANNAIVTGNYVTPNTVFSNVVQANNSVNTAIVSATNGVYGNYLQGNTSINTPTIYSNAHQSNTSINTATISATTTVFGNSINANTSVYTPVVQANNTVNTSVVSATTTVIGNSVNANTAVYTPVVQSNNAVNTAIVSATNTVFSNSVNANTIVYTPTVQANSLVNTAVVNTQTVSVTGTSYLNNVTANSNITSKNTANVTNDMFVGGNLYANNNINVTPTGRINATNIAFVEFGGSGAGLVNTQSLSVGAGGLSVGGNFVINGTTVYNTNQFTLSAATPSPSTASFNVYRVSNANASIQWSESNKYWSTSDVATGLYYRVLTDYWKSDSQYLASSSNVASSMAVYNLNQNLLANVTSINSSINTNVNSLNAAISANVATINGSITSNVNTLTTSINNSVANLNGSITANVNAINTTITNSVNTLQGEISSNVSVISGIDLWQNTAIGTAGTYANTAYNQANIATQEAVTSGVYANSAYAKANTNLNFTYGTGVSGTPAASLGGTININNTGVTSLNGTTNQVYVNQNTGAITLSLPQNIQSGASPTFNGANFSGIPIGGLQAYTISGVNLGGTLSSITPGSYIDGSSYNGSSGVTWNIHATSNNTGGYLVARDGSGNFSAGTITANLSGVASNATVNYNNNSNSTYQLLWGSGTGLYANGNVYVNPYYGYVYSNQFYTGGSVYGNIFYDVNNTNYYCQPRSTSNFAALNVGGSSVVTNNGGSYNINASNITAYTINQNLGTGNTPTYAGMESSGPIEFYGRNYSGPSIRIRDVSSGIISFYDNTDPDASIFNYTMNMDAGIFGFYMSGTNSAYDQGVLKASIDSAGNILAAGSVTAYSDARLKSNIQTISNALRMVCDLRGVRYIKDGKSGIGVIAQEVEQILPEVVVENTDEMKTLSVSYGNIVGVLIEAIKELKAEIDELKVK